ncbi:MAG: DUF4160 domain-containing protein [Ignavibacteriales bacterium]|nr:DUF4160 domain-containing protein [Ignavibacteriales bacterium]
MPEISRFFGIVVYMYGDDHSPPHFHAQYGEFEAMIDIATGEIIKGDFPKKQLRLIQAWTEIHRQELMNNFDSLRQEEQVFHKIEPLR